MASPSAAGQLEPSSSTIRTATASIAYTTTIAVLGTFVRAAVVAATVDDNKRDDDNDSHDASSEDSLPVRKHAAVSEEELRGGGGDSYEKSTPISVLLSIFLVLILVGVLGTGVWCGFKLWRKKREERGERAERRRREVAIGGEGSVATGRDLDVDGGDGGPGLLGQRSPGTDSFRRESEIGLDHDDDGRGRVVERREY